MAIPPTSARQKPILFAMPLQSQFVKRHSSFVVTR